MTEPRTGRQIFEGIGPSWDDDTPYEAGFYKLRLVKGGRMVGVTVWYGPPADPITGELLDRSHRWQIEVEGALVDDRRRMRSLWSRCRSNPITGPEYSQLCETRRWGDKWAPDGPEANPDKASDLLSSPSLF